MTDASERLERGEDAVSYAGAILDLYIEYEDRLPKQQEFELFWRRVGQLAYAAAFRAAELGRFAEAFELSRSGPSRWQNGAYWRSYPNHDALVSMLMAANGDPTGALARLSSREVESPEIIEAQRRIREMAR